MSHYNTLPKVIALAVIASPIWVPIYAVWYVFGGHKKLKQEKEKSLKRNREDQQRLEEYRKNYIPSKPIVFNSQAHKKSFD